MLQILPCLSAPTVLQIQSQLEHWLRIMTRKLTALAIMVILVQSWVFLVSITGQLLVFAILHYRSRRCDALHCMRKLTLELLFFSTSLSQSSSLCISLLFLLFFAVFTVTRLLQRHDRISHLHCMV